MSKLMQYVLTVSLILIVSGCSNNLRKEDETFKAPKYATFLGYQLGGDKYSIICIQGTVFVDGRSIKTLFYKADGSQKSLEEFCDEHDSSTRIK